MQNHQINSWGPGQNVACDTGRDIPAEVSTSSSREKLLGLWNSNDQKQERVLVTELYKICEADFHVLFGCLNSPGNGSNMASPDQHSPFQPLEFAKVLHVFSVFTKISNGILRLEDLLEALVDLCNLKNVFIVRWSVCVLHKILDFSSMGNEFGKRENVTVEEPICGNNEYDTNGCGNKSKESLSFANVADMLKQGQIPSELRLSIAKTPDISGFSNHCFATSVSGVYLVSLFERMCQISTESNDERIRCEALSVMNLILMRHNAYLERDKFAGESVFQSLSKLLRRGAGFSVQDRAVHALYLLCNCPKVIAMISSCLKEDGGLACSKDVNANNSFTAFQGLDEILIGLADCVACYGSATAEEMKLRRNAIFFLAFLGSSGRSGFEILLKYRLPKGTNFIAIILQSILSDLDLLASKSAKRSGQFTEQSLLIREALIFLNRLVSHPQYSFPVLEALTATRDTASMTVDVANRLTQKSKFLWPDNNTTKQIRESEILDLARLFKKRVFTFLGDNI